MFDPAQVVKDLLVAAGMGVFASQTGWGVFVGDLPDTPDTIILCSPTGGRDPYVRLSINEPSVQLFIRGKKSGYIDAQKKAADCVSALFGLSGYTHSSGDVYQSCNQIGDIAYLGQDTNSRPMFTANFWFIVLPVPTGNRVAIT